MTLTASCACGCRREVTLRREPSTRTTVNHTIMRAMIMVSHAEWYRTWSDDGNAVRAGESIGAALQYAHKLIDAGASPHDVRTLLAAGLWGVR